MCSLYLTLFNSTSVIKTLSDIKFKNPEILSLISDVELILLREKLLTFIDIFSPEEQYTLSKEDVILKIIIENDERLTCGERKQINENKSKQAEETFAFDTLIEEKLKEMDELMNNY
jgi:hypothetical protein